MNEQEIVATEEDMTELVDSIGVPMPGERERGAKISSSFGEV